jgi:multiple sugar transport system substrate-binding protein
MRFLRNWRRGLAVAAAATMLAACGAAGAESTGGTPTLNWYIFPEPSGSFAAAARDCSAASGGEYNIAIQTLPTAADGQRE